MSAQPSAFEDYFYGPFDHPFECAADLAAFILHRENDQQPYCMIRDVVADAMESGVVDWGDGILNVVVSLTGASLLIQTGVDYPAKRAVARHILNVTLRQMRGTDDIEEESGR